MKPLYLNDPEAKAIIRDFLQPCKFEETLNFGFAISNVQSARLKVLPNGDPVSPGTCVKPTWLDGSDLVDHDHPDTHAHEFVSENSFESASDYVDEPMTPASPANTRTQCRIIPDEYAWTDQTADDEFEEHPDDSDGNAFIDVPRNMSTTSYFEDLINRDMTLRMTLTKPELRASEQELYGWACEQDQVAPESQDSVDPLELQQLVFSDDSTGLSGVFAKGMPRKMSIRGLLSK